MSRNEQRRAATFCAIIPSDTWVKGKERGQDHIAGDNLAAKKNPEKPSICSQ